MANIAILVVENLTEKEKMTEKTTAVLLTRITKLKPVKFTIQETNITPSI